MKPGTYGRRQFFAPRSGLRWQDAPQQKPKPESEESRSESEGKSLINIHPHKEAAPMSTPGSLPSSRVNSQRQQPIRDRYLIAADFLRTLAAQSGGLPFRAETIENTSYAFQLIANELHNQYTLTYTRPMSSATAPTRDRGRNQ